MNMKKIAITILLFGIVLFSSGSVIEIKEEKALIYAQKQYNNLFIGNSPKDETTLDDINNAIISINKVSDYNSDEKNKMSDDLIEYRKYIYLKDKILTDYTGTTVSARITEDAINSYEEKMNSLSKKYKDKITSYIKDMRNQKANLDRIEARIRNLYYEGDRTNLKAEITKEEIEAIKTDLEKIPQIEYVNKNKELLDEAINEINYREAVNNSWIKLNVPYISQNKNNVLNGCEAASLLMALQYKGYLTDTTLYDYATNMPKSDNPYEGFTHDIYAAEPYTVAHWIAPEPLAKYGRESSGNQNIINGTGKSINELDAELDNGNPVVIYLTGKFRNPRDWSEDAPANLHVLLLVGYNQITGQHIIIDPWTHDDGRTSWTVSKAQLETIYNAVGKRNVIVR